MSWMTASSGVCDECGHDWREHDADGGCGECVYEIEHSELDAPDRVCTARPPGPPSS